MVQDQITKPDTQNIEYFKRNSTPIHFRVTRSNPIQILPYEKTCYRSDIYTKPKIECNIKKRDNSDPLHRDTVWSLFFDYYFDCKLTFKLPRGAGEPMLMAREKV